MTLSQAFFLGFASATLVAAIVFHFFRRWVRQRIGELEEKANNPLIVGIDYADQRDQMFATLLDQQRNEILGSFRIPESHLPGVETGSYEAARQHEEANREQRREG